MSFANCGLPYYIGHLVSIVINIAYYTRHFKEKKNIVVKTHHEVIEVNDQQHVVRVLNHQTGETFDETYDKLILSPGASANTLGFTNDFTFTLRNAEDMDQIDQYISRHKAKRALVVGAGYISLEVLENLYQRGLDVTWIHRSDKVNKLMDQDMNAAILAKLIKETFHID